MRKTRHRVLDPSGAPLLAELDMLDLELKRASDAEFREGIVIVTGRPIRKDATLYAAVVSWRRVNQHHDGGRSGRMS
jgi:hypothetical protein